MTQLSPLTLSNMRALREAPQDQRPGARQLPEQVTAYECPLCGDLHHDEHDAEVCCQGSAPEGHDQDGPVACPVCGSSHRDYHVAAECCLWHDLDAPTRWRVADAVEAGSSWEDAISGVTS